MIGLCLMHIRCTGCAARFVGASLMVHTATHNKHSNAGIKAGTYASELIQYISRRWIALSSTHPLSHSLFIPTSTKMKAGTFDTRTVAPPLSAFILASVCYSIRASYGLWKSRKENSGTTDCNEKFQASEIKETKALEKKTLRFTEPDDVKPKPRFFSFPELWKKTMPEEDLEKNLPEVALAKPELVLLRRPVLKSYSKKASIPVQPVEPWVTDFTTLADPTCNFCDTTFETSEQLKTHKTGSHPFGCKIEGCNISLQNREDLATHYKRADELLSCTLCTPIVTFTLTGTLNRHTRSEHEGDVFTCEIGECLRLQTRFRREDNLKRHMRGVHRMILS